MAVNKLRPTAQADDTSTVSPTRTGKYGEAYNFPMGIGRYGLADEGSYYTVGSVIGTDITAHAAPAIADGATKPLLHIFNGSSDKDIYLDYIEMLTTIANASATAVAFRGYVDNKGSTGRTGAGTALTPVNTRSNSSNTSGATVYAGAVTAVATSERLAYSRVIKEFIGVALDRYSFSFGNGLVGNPTTSYTAGATAIVCYGPPIVIGPGGNLYFCQVSPSGASTAATFQFELGFWER
jgi:hypothetical protein